MGQRANLATGILSIDARIAGPPRCWARLRRKNSDRVIAVRKLPSIRRSDRVQAAVTIDSQFVNQRRGSKRNVQPRPRLVRCHSTNEIETVHRREWRTRQFAEAAIASNAPAANHTLEEATLKQFGLIGTDQNIIGETGRCWGERRGKYRLQLACRTNRVYPNVTNSPEAHEQQVPRTVNLDLRVRLWR